MPDSGEKLGKSVLELTTDDAHLKAGLGRAHRDVLTSSGSMGRSFASRVTSGVRSASAAVVRLGKTAISTVVDFAKKAALVTAGIGIAAGFGAKIAIDKASDLNESLNKVDVVFGKASDKVVEYSKTAARGLGQSQQQALEAAGTFGNLFRAIGLAEGKSADMSTSMVTLASDLASFNNADPSDVLEALRAGLVGETEPLRRFGINLTDARMREEAVRLGLTKTTKEVLPPAIKAQAAYSLILKDSTLAQGDFARTSSGLANQQRILAAVWDDSLARIGSALLPLAVELLPRFVDFVEMASKTITEQIIPAIQKWIAENRPLIDQVIAFVSGALTTLVGFVQGSVIPAFAGSGGKPGIIPTVVDFGRQLFEWVIPKVQAFIDTLTKPGGVVDSILKVVGPIISKLLPAFGAIVDALFGKSTNMRGRGAVGKTQRGLIPALGDLIGKLWGDGNGALATVVKVVAAAFTDVLAPALAFVIDKLASLIDWISSAIDWIADLLGPINDLLGGIGDVLGSAGLPLGKGAPRAAGGLVIPGGHYKVGEQGPEDLLMGRNGVGVVIPQAGSQAASSERPIVFHLHYARGESAPGDVRRSLRRATALGLVG